MDAILDVRKSRSISFLAISDRYTTLLEIVDKMAAVGHFGCPKFTLDHISGHFRSIQIFVFLSISHRYATLHFFTKWLPVAILDVYATYIFF